MFSIAILLNCSSLLSRTKDFKFCSSRSASSKNIFDLIESKTTLHNNATLINMNVNDLILPLPLRIRQMYAHVRKTVCENLNFVVVK
jgi:hypothetical protein